MEVHVFQIWGLWFCSCCFVFCKGHRCFFSKTALDTVPFTQTSVHYIILKASRANRQIASNDTFLFGAFVVWECFFLTFAERTKKLQLQFGGCLDCQFWQCLNVKQFSYVCVNNTWTCCSKPSRRDVSSVQSPIDIQLFWLGRDSYHNVRHEILPQIKLASCSSRFFTAKNMQIFRVNGCFLAKIQASRAVTGWCLLVPRKGADSLSQFWGHEFMNSCRWFLFISVGNTS